MLSVHWIDVLASLGLNLIDKCLKLVDRYRGLTAIERCLGCIEFGEQAVGHSLTRNKSLACGMLDASRQGSYRWGKRTFVGCLCSRCARGEQIEPNKCNKGKQYHCYYNKALFHDQMSPLEITRHVHCLQSHQLLK